MVTDQQDRTEIEPTLSIIDSILLPFPTNDADALESNAPTFVLDPLHRDSFYVQHNFGCDAISIRSWMTALREEGVDLPASEVVRMVESSGSV